VTRWSVVLLAGCPVACLPFVWSPVERIDDSVEYKVARLYMNTCIFIRDHKMWGLGLGEVPVA
jgi:hypothetical protein